MLVRSNGGGASRETLAMFVDGLLVPFVRHGCRFVVIGSAARMLCGDAVEPSDLDLVVDADPAMRPGLVASFDEVDGRVVTRHGWRSPGDVSRSLPWDWGFTVQTGLGPVDVISRLIDGTGIDDHERVATVATLSCGTSVRVHPTSRVA